MKGTQHFAVGGVIGGIVAMSNGADPVSVGTGISVLIGGIAGLVPDLDTNGMLSGKISVSSKLIKFVAILIGAMMIMYSFFQSSDEEMVFGISIGIGIIVLSQLIITQKRMLLVTGIGVVMGGLSLGILWIILTGVYIGVASLLPHRSYTHSLIGLGFFVIISFLVSLEFNSINGLFTILVLGYVSHLVCDMKFIPLNKRGVKLFKPFSNIEI